MYEFDFLRPSSRDEAEAMLLADEERRIIAGGMSLLPAMKLHLSRPSGLIDLSAIEGLKGITITEDSVTIGAMTRHADVAASAELAAVFPALCELAGGIGDRQVRNRGTIGGSVANSDPAACYPSSVLGAGATILTNRREIIADDFFLDLFETALEPGEFITAIRYPIPAFAAYEKFRQKASRFSLVGVFVTRAVSGEVRVAVTGSGPCVFRASGVEAALSADFSPASAEAVTIDPTDLNSDIHAGAEYRAALIPVVAARAVQHALGRKAA